MRRALTVALVAIALATPSPAIAATPPEGWGDLDLRIAHEYWGTDHSPLCMTEAVYFDDDVAVAGALGRATETTEPGTECVMYVVPGQGVIAQCDTIVHEFGHWLGMGHSPDPDNVMYAYEVASAVPGRCLDTLRFLHPDATRAQEESAFGRGLSNAASAEAAAG